MNHKIAAFLQKNAIAPENIKYILREDGKTNVYLLNDRVISTYHPIKDFREYLPVAHFLCPNKGILLAENQVVDIKDGCYLTADGRSFKYRIHNSQMHDTRLLTLGRSMEHASSAPHHGPENYRCLDKMPLSVCVLECIPKDYGFGTEFYIRYCNQHLLNFEGLKPEDVLGRTVAEVFPHTNPKWLVAYADVALNDTVRTVDEYNHNRDVWIRAYCHQCAPHHCMCTLISYSSNALMNLPEGDTRVGLI